MYSATFPEEVQTLARKFLQDYIFLAVGPVGGANSDVVQTFVEVERNNKRDNLMRVLEERGMLCHLQCSSEAWSGSGLIVQFVLSCRAG